MKCVYTLRRVAIEIVTSNYGSTDVLYKLKKKDTKNEEMNQALPL